MKRLIKKIIRAFLCLWACLIFLPINVSAETLTYSFSRFTTSAASYTPQCNDSYCVYYNYPVFLNQTFTSRWDSSSSKTCNSNTILSGRFAIEGSDSFDINMNWLERYLQEVYISTNGTSYTCNKTLFQSGTTFHVNFVCSVPKLTANPSFGYRFSTSADTGFTVPATSIIYRSINVTCDSNSTDIINNNNFNTDRIIRDADRNSELEREKIQDNTDAVNGLKEEQQETNDTLKDSSVDSSDSTINNLKDRIPTNSVISDLLLLPVRFLQNFVNALGSSCSTFSLGSLYGTELFMPCINIENYLGSAIWTTIDLILSGFFVYTLRKKFIEIYENLTNLKNGGNEVD